jgi:hypothetical protein
MQVKSFLRGHGAWAVFAMAACAVAALLAPAAQAAVTPQAAGSVTILVSQGPGPAPKLVGFMAQVAGHPGLLAGKWDWTFDDLGDFPPGQSELQNPTHLYMTSRKYNVSVTFTDTNGVIGPKGATYSGKTQFTIPKPTMPATISAAPDPAVLPGGGEPVAVKYTVKIVTTGLKAGPQGWGYYLRVYDQNGEQVGPAIGWSSPRTTGSATVKFTEAGTYRAIIMVSDAKGVAGAAITENVVED